MDDVQLDLDKLLQVFAEQSAEALSSMEEALVALETRPDDPELLHTIFRVCHTLKGDAGSLGLPALTELAHVLEDLLERLREGTVPVSSDLTTLLLESVDVLRLLVGDATQGKERSRPEQKELLARLRESAAEPSRRKRASRRRPPADQVESLDERSKTLRPSLRVRVETLDRLLNLTGELAVARSHLTQMFEAGSQADLRSLAEAHHAIDPLFAGLQEEVMRVRLVPVGPLFRQHHRTVRDQALAHDKKVRLQTQGEEAELDTTVIEQLRDPLSHMIRNAVAHGIESPRERQAAGKDPCGCVTLRAFHDGGTIVVQVADDGGGFDRERIRERAIRLGLLAEADHPSDAQLDRLVFEPGFSTARSATLSSGRGVGMDVVRRNIEALHGTVDVESSTGKGTTITLRLPLTLAIIEGFSVGVGDEVYVLPLGAVVECIDLAPSAQGGSRDTGLIDLRGRALPYIRLRRILRAAGQPPSRESVVVIRSEGQEAGIVVDALQGEKQAVIKPLGRLFRHTPGIAGSTILGDGRVALILDAADLLRAAVTAQRCSNDPGGPPLGRKHQRSEPGALQGSR